MDLFKHDILLYVPGNRVLLKIQQGTGDNLEDEDYDNGYIGYFIWNKFKPTDLGIDEELDMNCIDSGMVMYTEDDDSETIYQNILDDAGITVHPKLLFTDKDL